MVPRVSIIICTLNREEILSETLASIGQCEVPSDLPTELLVVDNGSTDSTRRVVGECALQNMPVRYVLEPRPGKSHAYNTSIREAGGSVLLYTDDDVRVPEDWIEGMCRPIVDGEADAVAGGVVFSPVHERRFAERHDDYWRGCFASTDEIDPVHPGRMVGANMAFRRDAALAVPEFDPQLGAGALGFHEETLFASHLIDRGYRLIARLDVAVEHHFDLSRLSRRNLLSVSRRMGASDGYVAWHRRHVRRVPTRWDWLRMKSALYVRRALRPRGMLRGTVERWECDRIKTIAYQEQLWIESKKPRRYARSQQAAAEVESVCSA